MSYREYKTHNNDEGNLYVYKFDNDISKIENEITKIPAIQLLKSASHLQKVNLSVVPKISWFSEVLSFKLVS